MSGTNQFIAEQTRQEEQAIEQQAQLDKQAEQFKLQQDSIKRQNFETSFFQLVNLQNQLVSALSLGNYHGKKYFTYHANNLANEYDQFLRRRTGGRVSSEAEKMQEPLAREFFEEYYKTYEDSMAHYFRNLYHIFKFVKASDIDNKRRYTSLVRAQLSKFELLILFYNCLTKYGNGFKPLVEEFGLFEHLDIKTLIHTSHINFYASTAYL